ncbi:MarR family winged helix-turn-helix transcriptional regulator [Singulisphaera sp. PoT]|uniref:MarR family winged helix-turn-helix transcriptional regulator n=1 Tax=Singulisphaera sp. PoT TaxID=3411797 RepID=UPI003BF47E03
MSDSASLDLFFGHLHVLQAILAEAEPRIRAVGLEMKEFFLLNDLDASPYPADLARKLMLPKPSITFLIKRLEAGAFLTRSLEPGDLRRFFLTMTPKGREAVAEARMILEGAFASRLKRLTTVERDTLIRILQKIGDAS